MCHVEGFAHLKIPLCDVKSATDDFAVSNLIGHGGYGNVYKGETEHHDGLAVKRLVRKRGQGTREFMMEIALLSTCKHENLVPFVGFCDEDGENILVYKFVKNGSLDEFLGRHDPTKKLQDLSWVRRLHICLGAARGLRYLHDETSVLHCDIKSANILLDENWNAKISDFGLSRVAPAKGPLSVVITSPCGTPGYVDPSFLRCILSRKSDVYSFGIVLFEVLLGRLVIDKRRYHLDKAHFSVQAVRYHYKKKTLDEIIDPCLRTQMDPASLRTFADTAYRCLKNRRKNRPTMSVVVEELEKALHRQVSNHQEPVISPQIHSDQNSIHKEGLSACEDDKRELSVLLKAIEGSRCFVVVFSKKFAANSGYLDEVGKIIECMKERRSEEGHHVPPLYYEVHRSGVRTHPTMSVWKNALVKTTKRVFRIIDDLGKEVATKVKRRFSGLR